MYQHDSPSVAWRPISANFRPLTDGDSVFDHESMFGFGRNLACNVRVDVCLPAGADLVCLGSIQFFDDFITFGDLDRESYSKIRSEDADALRCWPTWYSEILVVRHFLIRAFQYYLIFSPELFFL